MAAQTHQQQQQQAESPIWQQQAMRRAEDNYLFACATLQWLTERSRVPAAADQEADVRVPACGENTAWARCVMIEKGESLVYVNYAEGSAEAADPCYCLDLLYAVVCVGELVEELAAAAADRISTLRLADVPYARRASLLLPHSTEKEIREYSVQDLLNLAHALGRTLRGTPYHQEGLEALLCAFDTRVGELMEFSFDQTVHDVEAYRAQPDSRLTRPMGATADYQCHGRFISHAALFSATLWRSSFWRRTLAARECSALQTESLCGAHVRQSVWQWLATTSSGLVGDGASDTFKQLSLETALLPGESELYCRAVHEDSLSIVSASGLLTQMQARDVIEKVRGKEQCELVRRAADRGVVEVLDLATARESEEDLGGQINSVCLAALVLLDSYMTNFFRLHIIEHYVVWEHEVSVRARELRLNGKHPYIVQLCDGFHVLHDGVLYVCQSTAHVLSSWLYMVLQHRSGCLLDENSRSINITELAAEWGGGRGWQPGAGRLV
jgi:hypothetical protein